MEWYNKLKKILSNSSDIDDSTLDKLGTNVEESNDGIEMIKDQGVKSRKNEKDNLDNLLQNTFSDFQSKNKKLF